MKYIFSICLLYFSFFANGQDQPSIKVTADSIKSRCFDNATFRRSKYKKNIDSAFEIVSAVFNDSGFPSKISTTNFPCENRCCISCKENHDSISGKEILDSLFRELNVTMTIRVKKKCRGKLGSTLYHQYYTLGCLKNIQADMPKLPLSYAIAVNLCHEYMHHIGFYHSHFDLSEQKDNEIPNPDGYKNDIAYR